MDTKALQCILFVRALKDLDVLALGERLFALIRERAVKSVRFCQRITPIEQTCMAKIDDIRVAASALIAEHFRGDSAEFSVGFESRLNNSLDRMTVINMLVDMVGPRHKVNLGAPQKVIVVQIFKNMCAMSVLDNWVANRKYNAQEVLKEVLATQ